MIVLSRFLFVLTLLLTLLPTRSAIAAPRCFPEAAPAIADCIDGRIRDFWERQGGLPVFGYPLTPVSSVADGVSVQLFERARIELHPRNAPPYDVQLGRLGADALARRNAPPAPRQAPSAGCLHFAESGQNLCPPFLEAWHRYGLELGQPGISVAESLALFGLPLTPPQRETLSDGKSYTVQWFERARFEDHGAAGVLFGLLGRETIGTAPVAPPTGALPPGGFLEARGNKLFVQGVEVRLKGVNYYPQWRPWAEMWLDWDAHQTARELTLARDRLGLNAVRVLLPYDPGDRQVAPQTITRLREIVQIAGDLQMRVVVTLFDFYEEFAPVGTQQFERDLNYLRTLLANFAGDDRIVAWDLHNEPDHYKIWAEGKAPQVLDWLGRMADEAHRAAPNQLVTVGMGRYDNLWQPGPDGRRVIDYSDIVSIHIYNAADAQRQLDELRTHTGKPILLEEFGWPTGPICTLREYNEGQQEWVYRTILQAAEGRTAGVMAWTLRDYDATQTKRWDSREEHYGLFRADDSLKPAAEALRAYPAAPLPSLTKSNLPLSSNGPFTNNPVTGPRLIEGSGHYVKREFRQVWELLGGQASLGLPLSEAFERHPDRRVVQYFEAGVLAYYPEVAERPDFGMLLPEERLLLLIRPLDIGVTYANTTGRSFAPPDPQRGDEVVRETGYGIGSDFKGFYDALHGYWRFGPPISNVLEEQINGVRTRVQYFRNGRIEWNPATNAVEAGRLGTWIYEAQCLAP